MKQITLIGLMVMTINMLFALNPVSEYAVKPNEYGMNYQEIKISTNDGAELNAWYFPAPQTSYKLVIVSDDGDGNMADQIEVASQFITLGYHVILYDYRGYGASSEFKINNQFYIYSHFRNDLDGVLAYAKEKLSNLPKITLYGNGIGAALSICAGMSTKIQFIIADSPYSTLSAIQQKIVDTQSKEVKLPLGYNKTSLEPEYALAGKNDHLKGILFIVGSEDLLYSDKDMKALMKIKKEISQLHIVKGATHKNTVLSNKEEYFGTIKSFINQ